MGNVKTWSVLSLLAAAVFAVLVSQGGTPPDDAVVTLTDDDFGSFVETNPIVLVEFYAPWCGHCKKLAPAFEAAAKKLKELEGGGVPLAKVDATVHKAVGEKYGVSGYPTLKLFRNGVPSDYDGGRNAEDIVAWIEKQTGPATTTVATQDELDVVLRKKMVVFVIDVKTETDAAALLFIAAAGNSRDSGSFVIFTGGKGLGLVSVHRKDEEVEEATADETKTEEEMKKFFSYQAFPLFGPINGDNYAQYVGRSQDMVWVCMSNEDSAKHSDQIRKVAKTVRSSFSFVQLNVEEFGSHAENALGVSEFPAVVVQKKSGRYIYPHSEYDSTKLETFLKDVDAGNIERAIRSEAIPETNDKPVKVVVAKTFEELVIRPDKDVLLEIYAPWCGHCKNLEPIYVELAETLAKGGNDHVVIAKMDGSANEAPIEGFEWKGFPTIFWIKAAQTIPITYEKGRTLKDMLQFVKESASKPVVHDEL
eukprot:TRINITY_DN94919_c3_g1_i1.p1 TRINITY_DN94919_c3_g1~~TRINITY_DN94919_c3_g1_i1.p1  ORF type:complete len:477 (-),score=62.60 TRINITY_DN94919_c3_g1_i1:186-1616(-)